MCYLKSCDKKDIDREKKKKGAQNGIAPEKKTCGQRYNLTIKSMEKKIVRR